MRGYSVSLERSLVPVQLVEDSLQRLTIYQVGGIDECSGLVGLDGFDGFGYQPVVSHGADLVLACEAHAQTEHRSPSSRVTPCSHSMCCSSTSSCAYLLYVSEILSTLSLGRDPCPAQPARTHAHPGTQNTRTAHQHCHIPRQHGEHQRCPCRPALITAGLHYRRRSDPLRLRTCRKRRPSQPISPARWHLHRPSQDQPRRSRP